jgi:hypothetical protein
MSPVTAAQPHKMRVERDSAKASDNRADLRSYAAGRVSPQGLVLVEAKWCSLDPFAAVRHEHRVTNHLTLAREEDVELKSLPSTATAQRHTGHHARLLTFKKSR